MIYGYGIATRTNGDCLARVTSAYLRAQSGIVNYHAHLSLMRGIREKPDGVRRKLVGEQSVFLALNYPAPPVVEHAVSDV